MRIGTFLAVSLICVLIYAGFNFWVTSVAEKAISQAPSLPDSAALAESSAACERATEYYDRLLENEPEYGNFELRENKLEIAQAAIDRSCPQD